MPKFNQINILTTVFAELDLGIFLKYHSGGTFTLFCPCCWKKNKIGLYYVHKNT